MNFDALTLAGIAADIAILIWLLAIVLPGDNFKQQLRLKSILNRRINR